MKDNMEGSYAFKEFSPGQRRSYQEAVRLYLAFLEARGRARAYQGGRHWKKIKGRDYLYQYFDRYGRGRSLGPRSPHTEELFAKFIGARQDATQRLRDLRLQLAEQARFCRAALLRRVPRLTARILNLLGQHEALQENLTVVGASAIYAYEFAAGAFLETSRDLDLFAGARVRLTLTGEVSLPGAAFLALLRKADRSFAGVGPTGLQAVNRTGFLVRVLGPGEQSGRPPGSGRESGPEDRGNLHDLLAAPRFSQVVIGQDGLPARMAVPDPRAFALHRLRRSELPPRGQAPKALDRLQAMAVAELVLRYLPQYHFFHADLRRFPAEVVRHAGELAEGLGSAADLDVEY